MSSVAIAHRKPHPSVRGSCTCQHCDHHADRYRYVRLDRRRVAAAPAASL